jgi:ABC-type uncharacterized transport system ATPase subunit
MTMKAKLCKAYSNHIGRRFQRVEIWDALSCLATFDICIRSTRDGLETMNRQQCKDRALYLYQQARSGLRHSSMVTT